MEDCKVVEYEVVVKGAPFKVAIDNKHNYITIKGVYSSDNNDLHSLVLGYRYNLHGIAFVNILSDDNRLIATEMEGKFVYNDEEFKLETDDDKIKATRVLLYEKHELLEKILGQLDGYHVINDLKKEVENSVEDKGVKEYIAMKHDPRIQKLLRGQK
jgi:hypothetical protein